MNNYPKMLPEVIEAIETHFCDEKDVMADCMLYLFNATSREEDVAQLTKWFEDNQRCLHCGTELQIDRHHEIHPEFDNYKTEEISAMYCPECRSYV